MSEAKLVFSNFIKNSSNFYSYDIIEYNNKFYSGYNLYKNFVNYLTQNWTLPVIIFSSYVNAYNHIHSIQSSNQYAS